MKTQVLVVLMGCIGCSDVDPEWQLNHDRIIAVRATPSHIQTGEVSVIDGLLANKGANPSIDMPISASATGDLSAALTNVDGMWEVIGPDEDTLDAARATLQLDPGAPVPFEISMVFSDPDGLALAAEKTVWLGDSQDNPMLGGVTVGGVVPGDDILIGENIDVALTIEEDQTWMVDWLTNVGTMHDDDEHAAVMNVGPTDQMKGSLVVVVRDTQGGVVWQVWPIEAQ